MSFESRLDRLERGAGATDGGVVIVIMPSVAAERYRDVRSGRVYTRQELDVLTLPVSAVILVDAIRTV